MSGPPTRYYDEGDEGELMDLLALLLDARDTCEREEAYASACALSEWVEELRDRLVQLIAVRQARELRAD